MEYIEPRRFMRDSKGLRMLIPPENDIGELYHGEGRMDKRTNRLEIQTSNNKGRRQQEWRESIDYMLS
jgi:hypothetical protein